MTRTGRRAVVAGLTGTAALAIVGARPTSATRRVVDSADRAIVVPDAVARVFAAGPPASILLYVLAPDRLLGWTRALHPEERPYIAPAWRDLPELGRLTGRGDTANLEVVLASRPDLVLDFGSIRDTYVSLAERVQARTGIPYALIDGRFANTAPALRRLGAILDVEARADTLARWAEDAFAEVDATLARVPEARRPRVYFARGPHGLETGTRGSINTEIIERVGAVNVAAAPGFAGLAQVSVEQVLAWDPEVIVALDDRFPPAAARHPVWRQLAAVRDGRVHAAPRLPFGWVDRPPAINRLIGLKWLTRLFYPGVAPDDLAATTREFYRLFYHVELDRAALDRLLAPTRPVRL